MYRFLFRTLYRARSHAVHAYGECVPSRTCDLSVLPFTRVANGGRPKGLSTSSVSYCESKGGVVLPPREDEKRDAKKDGDPAETATSADGKVDDEHKIIETMSALPPGEDEMRDAKKDLAETTTTEGKVDNEHELVKTTPEQEETLAGVKTEVEMTTRQQTDDAIRGEVPTEQQTVVEPETTKTEENLDVKMEVDKERERTVLKETEEEERKESETKRVTKSGKESLMDLLGTMKVDLTTKKTFKSLRGQPTHEPKPAAMESTITMFQKATAEIPAQSETLSPELVAAASAAASTLPNKSQAESELLRQLRQHEAVTEDQRKGEASDIGVIIADMKVGKRPTGGRQNDRAANQIRFDDDGQGYTRDRGIAAELDGVRRRRGLFSGKRLSIFSIPTDQAIVDTAIKPTLWDIDFTNQLVQSANNMPRNGFEEMIQLTKEGKLWQYPINNEAGLDEESLVPFHEHIFLEKHLEMGFPSRGPVRHFMELVVTGLAKNPHLTVRQKKEHIAWFKDYFQQKEDVLKEADVYLN